MSSTTVDRTFIDTNVLVYSVDAAEPDKMQRAREIISRLPARATVVSTQVLMEFYVTVTRKLPRPLTQQEAAGMVDDLSRLETVTTDARLVRAAIGLSRSATVSLFDALILVAAGEAGCTRVLTEDLAAGSTIGGVRIQNPFA